MPKQTVTPPTQPMGMVREPLNPPEEVGSISVAEAAEIRERRRLSESIQAQVKAKQDELNDLMKIGTVIRTEHRSYLEGLCRARGLDTRDDYNIETESGVILRTARSIEAPLPPVIEETTEAEPVAAEPNGSTKD